MATHWINLSQVQLSLWYTFGTTIWPITAHSSDARTFGGLHFIISTPFNEFCQTKPSDRKCLNASLIILEPILDSFVFECQVDLLGTKALGVESFSFLLCKTQQPDITCPGFYNNGIQE